MTDEQFVTIFTWILYAVGSIGILLGIKTVAMWVETRKQARRDSRDEWIRVAAQKKAKSRWVVKEEPVLKRGKIEMVFRHESWGETFTATFPNVPENARYAEMKVGTVGTLEMVYDNSTPPRFKHMVFNPADPP